MFRSASAGNCLSLSHHRLPSKVFFAFLNRLLAPDSRQVSKSRGVFGMASRAAFNGVLSRTALSVYGGGGGIRTHETLSGLTVFKTAGFNRSPTPPILSSSNIVACRP